MNNSFFDEVLSAAKHMDSLYSGNLRDRRALIRFMEQSGLLDASDFPRSLKEEIIQLKNLWIPSRNVMSSLLARLDLWLSAYGRSDQERLEILYNFGKGHLPDTCHTYHEFIHSASKATRSTSWELLDYLLSILDQEVPGMSPAQKESLISHAKDELPREHIHLFMSYLNSLANEDQNSHITYTVHTPKGSETETAYTFQEFSSMAYCIFNKHYWNDHRLLERACSSHIYANLWAFLAFFFVSGLRGTDVIRIPRPSLPYEGEEFRSRILHDEIDDPGSFARDVVFRMKYHELYPNKTASFTDVPNLKLSIPVSLEKPFGIILAVAASYYPESMKGEPFLQYSCSYRLIRQFFGKPLADILDRKGFNIKKANKAYLQGIEIAADAGKDSHAKGYLIAALARSHKGSLSTLPETTDVYLKDAAFSGLDPKLVLFEMFERGIFGFIPHLLLKTCFGDRYSSLNIFSQTSLIKEIGISPAGIESIAEAGSHALDRANTVVRELFEQHMDISDALRRIASGEAVAKQNNYLCLRTAAGLSCHYPDRRSCITCKYEICTKAALHQLTAEYSRLQLKSQDHDDWRSAEIIRTAILPTIQEFLFTIHILYQDADLSPYHQILQGGLDHYDHLISSDR